jgi:hypothetical protein
LIQIGEIERKNLKIFAKKNYTEKDLTEWLMKQTIDDIVVIPSVPNDIPVLA